MVPFSWNASIHFLLFSSFDFFVSVLHYSYRGTVSDGTRQQVLRATAQHSLVAGEDGILRLLACDRSSY